MSHRRRGRVRTTTPDNKASPAPELVRRDFAASEPNETWVADITYVPTYEGWLFLAAVMDLDSRKIVGWSMRDDLEAPLVVDASSMAIACRTPKPGLVHHSDRGSQGGFNWSSQHLDREELRWADGEDGVRCRPDGRRCVRLVVNQLGDGSIGCGSGRRSLAGCRARTRPPE